MTSSGVSRRTLLRATLGTAAIAGAAPALAGCGKRSNTTATNNTSVKLPTHVPFQGGPKPDLPATGGGMDGFLSYPASPVSVSNQTVGDGSTVTAFLLTYTPVPPGLSRNTFWQALNKALNLDLKISVVPSADYNDKFSTVVAGDLPDLLQIRTNVVDIPALLAAKCEDLTPYLSGDAAQEYPFLANIPTASWKASCVHNGGIYGVPVPRGVLGQTFLLRADILAAKGLNPAPASFADFKQLCLALTDPRNNQWALTNGDAALQMIQQMLGVPNANANIGGWKVEGGKLTNTNELEETKQALSDAAALVKAGAVHPDSFGTATQDLSANYKQWFNAGSAVLHTDNYPAWYQFYSQNVAGPTFKVGAFLPPNYDANVKAVTWQGNPAFSYTAFKKASPERIKLLLKLCNWMAAPFGSAEYLLKNDGVEGVDWQRTSTGDVQGTSTGQSEVPGLAVQYICSSPYVLYSAGQEQATKDIFAFQEKFIPMSVQDPTLGLDFHSTAEAQAGGKLAQILTDARHAIMRGQQPVSSWDDTVKQWRSSGGDEIRNDYQQQLQQNG